MPAPSFALDSTGHIAVVILGAVGTGYLLSLPRKSAATWWFLVGIAGFTLNVAVWVVGDLWPGLGWTASGRRGLSVAAYTAGLVPFWALVQFAYRFVETPFPREARAVGWAAGAALVAGRVAYVAEAFGPPPRSAVPERVVLATDALILVWGIAVFVRKRAWTRRRHAPGSPGRRSARAYAAYAALVGLQVAVAALNGLPAFGVPLGPWVRAVAFVVQILFAFGLLLVYLNHAPEPTTVRAKLVGLALVTTLALLVTVGVVAEADARRDAWASGAVPDRRAVRYDPTPDGGYAVSRAPYAPAPVRGADLGLRRGETRPVALGFAFPFADARWDSVGVRADGEVRFGPDGHAAVYPLATALDPEGGGSVRVERGPGWATVTWAGVPRLQTREPLTFRVTLRADGAVEAVYDRVPPSTASGRLRWGLAPRPLAYADLRTARPDPAYRIGPGEVHVEDFKTTHRARSGRLATAFAGLAPGATALVVLLFLAVFQGSLIRPLRRLLAGVRRVRSGDLDAELALGTRDEFGRLADGFNGMTTALRRYATEMEGLVAERTAALEEAQGRLVHQEKMASLGALTAGIAHEIKNPLNFVTNFAGLTAELADELAAETDPDERAVLLADIRGNVGKIEAHGRRADAIVRSMMDHARTGTGERRAVRLDRLVEEYAGLAAHADRACHPGRPVPVVLDLAGDGASVEVAAEDVGRAVVNLVDNALDAVRRRAATEGGGYAPAVTVSTASGGGAAVVRVEDNGPGIAPEVAAQVFEPFFTTKPTGEGTGLGLSLSHDIVVQGHGGALTVEPAASGGAAFVITLPTADGPTAAGPG